MIKPSEAPQKKNNDEVIEAAIEAHFDGKLRQGDLSIGYTRSGWPMQIVNKVLEKYRANGWRVTDTGRSYDFEAA